MNKINSIRYRLIAQNGELQQPKVLLANCNKQQNMDKFLTTLVQLGCI